MKISNKEYQKILQKLNICWTLWEDPDETQTLEAIELKNTEIIYLFHETKTALIWKLTQKEAYQFLEETNRKIN